MSNDPANENSYDDDEVALDEGGDDQTAKRVRIAVAGLVVLLVGVLIGNLTAPRVQSNANTDLALATVSDVPGLTSGPPRTFPAGDVNRQAYWGVVGLRTLVYDTFDRDDNALSLGKADTGQEWKPVTGSWGIKDKQPIRTVGTPGAPSLAVVPVGSGNGLMEVTMTTVEAGAGLVFRYRDPQNYWTVTANPASNTWTASRVIDGNPEAINDFAASTKDGVTITVTQAGPSLRFLVDSIKTFELSDPALEGELQGGIVANGDSVSGARWARFLTMNV